MKKKVKVSNQRTPKVEILVDLYHGYESLCRKYPEDHPYRKFQEPYLLWILEGLVFSPIKSIQKRPSKEEILEEAKRKVEKIEKGQRGVDKS